MVDVDRQIILAQSARQAPWNDCATLPLLVAQAHAHTPIGCVLADAEFDSERDHTFCRQQLSAPSVIPAKRRSSCRASGVRLQMRENFPAEQYGKTLPDREYLLGGQTQTLLPRTGQNHPHTAPPSAPARSRFQHLPPQTAYSLTANAEDVNRAKHALKEGNPLNPRQAIGLRAQGPFSSLPRCSHSSFSGDTRWQKIPSGSQGLCGENIGSSTRANKGLRLGNLDSIAARVKMG